MIKQDVFLSLGSNINRELHIQYCLKRLKEVFGVIRCSPVYESEPVGFQGDCFYNLAVKVTTTLSLSELTATLKHIEDQSGRLRGGEKFSSRTLDIDVLTYGDKCGVYDGIELPRPELFYNAFVLLPMADLAPLDIEPKTQRSYAELWSVHQTEILKQQKLWQIEFEWPEGI